ncbi:unnamed protein product [Cuscuta europaea]|uniref:Uncharacterized protein n=1 Tax=Cuscuta europaea TaxID=41803 RepID=A0A9P1EH51_CUSEU|nr:unnamed protein product [Cuscuta europaea]
MQEEIQNPEEVEEERDTELELVKEEDEPCFKVKYLSLSFFEVPPTVLKTSRETHKIEKDKDIFEIFTKIKRSKHFPLIMLIDNFFPSLSPHESMEIWIFDPGKIFEVKSQNNYHDPSLND